MSLPFSIWLVIFPVSLFFLIQASDYFTDSAEAVGKVLRLPSFIIGVTIVSIGTSLPELVSSLFAVMQGSSEIVIGNVVGSNIANIFLIVGVAAVTSEHLKIKYNLTNVDLPLFVGSAFFLGLTVIDRYFSLGESLLCIVGFAVYLFYTVTTSKNINEEEEEEDDPPSLPVSIAILVVSCIVLSVAANYTVESVIHLSKIFDVGTEVIAVSALAIGTSLPELMVTINFVKKGNAEIAVGNVLGSNIFNSLVVMGIPALVGELIVPMEILTEGLPLMIIGTILLFFVTQDRQVTRWEGLLFFLFYGWFIGRIFNVL